MPALRSLDVVNDMLACLGELPVNSLDEGHPMVPTALRVLGAANTREQAKSWWFNRELTTLLPDVNGYVMVPQDTIKVDPSDKTLNYVQRGRKLYKPYDKDNKDTFTDSVEVWLVRELPFEDCPISAQNYISYSAQLDFMKSYEADAQKFQQVGMLYADALKTLNAEHVRAMDVNLLRRGCRGSVTYYPHR